MTSTRDESWAAAPSAKEFLVVLRENFVAAMGGTTSVVGTLLAAFVPNLPMPFVVGATAVTAGVLSAYAIWAKERTARVASEANVRPSLRLVEEAGAAYMEMVTADENEDPCVEYHRIVLVNDGVTPVHDVRAYLRSLDGQELSFGPLELIPMHGHVDPERRVTAFHDVPIAFDLIEYNAHDAFFRLPSRERFLHLQLEQHEVEVRIVGDRGATVTYWFSIGAESRHLSVSLLDKPTGFFRQLTPVSYETRRTEDRLREENRQLRSQLTALAPRRLTDAQRATIRNHIRTALGSAHSPPMSLHILRGEGPDCGDYARQFGEVLQEAGLRVMDHSPGQHVGDDFYYGLTIRWDSGWRDKQGWFYDGPVLADALRAAGIETTVVEREGTFTSLIVGSRPH